MKERVKNACQRDWREGDHRVTKADNWKQSLCNGREGHIKEGEGVYRTNMKERVKNA